MRNKAMTLVELIVTLTLVSGIILLVSAGSIFFVNQLQANLERSNLYSQMNYAMDDLRMRSVSAVAIEPRFSFNGEKKNELIFEGEKDIYNVTLNILTDNSWYKYYLTNPDPDKPAKKDLVVKSCPDLADSTCSFGTEEILIEKKFKPEISFFYDQDTPANLLRVVLTAEGDKVPLGASQIVTKVGGIRFWFIDAAK
ncbi:MAG: type II secretion system protein [Candidatus Omnitrophota bacterium]